MKTAIEYHLFRYAKIVVDLFNIEKYMTNELGFCKLFNKGEIMNFKVFFRILVIGIVGIFLSASVYADEDHLSISPTTLNMEPDIYYMVMDYGTGAYYADTGKLEVTISGTRDSNEVEIISYSYEVSHCCGGNIVGGGSILAIKATIQAGGKPGKSTYEKKFLICLEPGLYRVEFLVNKYQGSTDWKFVNVHDTRYLYVKGPIPINIDNITGASISGRDSFKLEGIEVPGNTEKYRGSFKWNPNTLSFDLIGAGVITDENGN